VSLALCFTAGVSANHSASRLSLSLSLSLCVCSCMLMSACQCLCVSVCVHVQTSEVYRQRRLLVTLLLTYLLRSVATQLGVFNLETSFVVIMFCHLTASALCQQLHSSVS